MQPPSLHRETSDACCSICLEAFTCRVETVCGHPFCAECIVTVLREHSTFNRAPCPFCRAPLSLWDLKLHTTGEPLAPPPLAPADAIIGTVGGAWFGDQRYITRIEDDGALSPASHGPWCVKQVCWFDCGGTVRVPAGAHDVYLRVKRERGFRFHSPLSLLLDGLESRRVDSLEDDLRESVGGWQLMRIGTVAAASASRDVKASVRAIEQGSWKGGLLVDCLVALPAGASLRHPFASDESGMWLVRWQSGATKPITLTDGGWTVFGATYQLRDTSPVTFTWPVDNTVQTLEAFDGTTITWSTSHPDYPIIYWERIIHASAPSVPSQQQRPRRSLTATDQNSGCALM